MNTINIIITMKSLDNPPYFHFFCPKKKFPLGVLSEKNKTHNVYLFSGKGVKTIMPKSLKY